MTVPTKFGRCLVRISSAISANPDWIVHPFPQSTEANTGIVLYFHGAVKVSSQILYTSAFQFIVLVFEAACISNWQHREVIHKPTQGNMSLKITEMNGRNELGSPYKLRNTALLWPRHFTSRNSCSILPWQWRHLMPEHNIHSQANVLYKKNGKECPMTNLSQYVLASGCIVQLDAVVYIWSQVGHCVRKDVSFGSVFCALCNASYRSKVWHEPETSAFVP